MQTSPYVPDEPWPRTRLGVGQNEVYGRAYLLTLDKVLTVTPMSVGVPGGCAQVVSFRSKVCV